MSTLLPLVREKFHCLCRFSSILSIIALTDLAAFAQFPTEYGIPRDPAYLMPISSHSPYEESVEKLLGNKWGWGTMIYYGGANSENDFLVSVWGSNKKPKTVTLIRFSPKDESSAETKSEVDVPIDTDFADAVYKAWCSMLLKTRYPKKIPQYADASTVEFSAQVPGAGAAYGKGVPVTGFQKELMDFGFELKNYCLAKEADRNSKRVSMIPRLKDFAARVEQSHLY